MLVSFTGAQSTGKTTLLKICKSELTGKKFVKYPEDDIYKDEWSFVDEVTRKVGRMGHTINEGGDNLTQLYILKEHLENHFLHGKVVLDRCILDGYVYTHWLYRKDKVDSWVREHAKNLLSFLGDRLDVIFYTEPDDIPLDDDGERSIDVDFRNEIVEIYEDVMTETGSIPGRHTWRDKIVRLSGTVDERMSIIRKTLDIDE